MDHMFHNDKRRYEEGHNDKSIPLLIIGTLSSPTGTMFMTLFTRRTLLAGSVGGVIASVTPPLFGQAHKVGPDSGASGLYPGNYRVAAPPIPDGHPALVKTRLGTLEGMESGRIRYFRSVPFAEPPVGPLRFRRAEPVKPWQGVRKATANPPAAVQSGIVAEAPRVSEDCLYLNIWAPSTRGPHPVYVYVHGGANVTGYSLEHRVNGANFARDGIVCVNVGYRLGAFGFLELGEVLGAEYAGSGNNGLYDLITALEWVRDNIQEFGGDPHNVTIGGQSAGAFNVLSLAASPVGKGLFRRVISQSGSGHGTSTREAAQAAGARFLAAATARSMSAADLLTASPDMLLELQDSAIVPGILNGFIDGDFLPDLPYRLNRWMQVPDRQLLIGYDLDEVAVLGGADPATFSLIDRIAFDRFRTTYPQGTERQQAIRFRSAMQFGVPSALYADAFALSGGRVHAYEWRWTAESGRFAGTAFHGIEQPFVWDNPRSIAFRDVTPLPSHRLLAHRLHRRWVSFIRSGNPAASGTPEWPSWLPDERRILAIGDRDTVDRSRLLPARWAEGVLQFVANERYLPLASEA
jgi:para-nitrobenzyl esterase